MMWGLHQNVEEIPTQCCITNAMIEQTGRKSPAYVTAIYVCAEGLASKFKFS